MSNCNAKSSLNCWGEKLDDVVMDCQVCGYKHVIELPSPEALRKLYEEEFYQSDKKEYIAASSADDSWRDIEFGRRYDIVEKKLSNRSGERLTAFDIGCGPGDFLAHGKDRGWDVRGIEPSPVASKYARSRGLDVQTGFFDANAANNLPKFDFVHMSEVVEHVPNPLEVIQLAKGLLKENGILTISVPNDFSPMQRALVDACDYSPWWVVPNHHLNYFDFDSLANLIVKAGLDVFDKTTNFPMEMFLLMGQAYTQKPDLGRKLHGWRKNFDLNMAVNKNGLHEDFYRALADVGMGRLVVLFAQFPND